MARITVEDCLERIPNLFDLVLTASKRSRRLANGAEAMVEWENDKPTVVALREIAAGHVNADILEESDQQQLLESVFEDDPGSRADAETPEQAPAADPAQPAAPQAPQETQETQIIPPTGSPLE